MCMEVAMKGWCCQGGAWVGIVQGVAPCGGVIVNSADDGMDCFVMFVGT